MEVTLTSTFYTKVTSSMIYTFFQPGFEFSTLKNPGNDTPLAFIVRCSGKWCLTSIWPPFLPEMTSIWPCLSENGYLVTLECSIIPNHPRMLDFKGPRKHLWFWRSWRSNGGQNEVGSIRRWHIRKIWAKIELCAKKTPNRLKTVTANPHPPLKCPSGTPPFQGHTSFFTDLQINFDTLSWSADSRIDIFF